MRHTPLNRRNARSDSTETNRHRGDERDGVKGVKRNGAHRR